MYLHVDHEIVFPSSGSNSKVGVLISGGAKYNRRDIRLLLVRNLIEELERAKIAPPPDRLEDQVQVQKMFCDSRVFVNTDQ